MSEHSYPEVNDEGKVICQICGRPFLVISVTHLKKHGITLGQYRTRYPDMPISSKEFKMRGKFGRMGLFKQGSKVSEDIITDDDLPEKKAEHVTGPVVEDLPEEKAEQVTAPVIEGLPEEKVEQVTETVKEPSNPITRKKREILDYLKGIYSTVQENYFIQKVDLEGHLKYEFITDFADPLLKIDFEFPDTFWHNKDRYVDTRRNEILRSDGWKIIEIRSNCPTLKMLEEAVSRSD